MAETIKKFVVLGGYGIIGRIVVLDLFRTCKDCEIIVAGRDLEKAERLVKKFKSKRIKAKQINLSNKKALVSLLKNSDVCINCVQYYLNLDIMRSCLEAKTNYVDLGGMFHMTKKQLKLNKQFKKINRLAILGCGATPGITNIMVSYGSKFFKKINSVEILFADKDETKYEQKFVLPYSFQTIIDEYTLKPAVFDNGKLKFAQPYSGIKKYSFKKEFGEKYKEIEGFYTLHSELATLPKFLENKGIKKIEFRVTFEKSFNEIIKSLIMLGFASKENIETTSKIMDRLIINPKTKIKDAEILKTILYGGNNKKMILETLTNSTLNISGGSYDTGIPCSIASQLIAKKEGILEERGVYAPENVINPEIFFRELKKRGVKIYKNGNEI